MEDEDATDREKLLALILGARSELEEGWRFKYHVGSRLHLARMSRGVGQAALSEAVGISETSMRKLEKREWDAVPLQVMIRAARVLELPLLALIDDEDLLPGKGEVQNSWRSLRRSRRRGLKYPSP
jgi:transcriptional regulator with XRE-family HTH domain